MSNLPRGRPRPLRPDVDLAELEWILPHVLQKLAEVTDLVGKKGGMFCLFRNNGQHAVVAPMVVGEVDNLEKRKCSSSCLSNAAWLLNNPEQLLSWDSQYPEMGEYAGAFNDSIFSWSFSGLKPEQNEAFVLMVAHLCNRIGDGVAVELAKATNNRILLDNPFQFWLPPRT